MMFDLNNAFIFSESRDKFVSENPKSNEDSFIFQINKDKKYLLLGVADGVGSYKGAKEASKFVCNFLEKNENLSHTYLETHLANDINQSFHYFINELSEEYIKAATTLSICFFDREGLSIWHVGDCRIYLKHGSRLLQLTHDHTQYQQLLDKKIYSKKELLEQKINKNKLTTAISAFIELKHEYQFFSFNELKFKYSDDISLILMSDGAHNFWEQRQRFSETTMIDLVKFGNALKRRIERKGPVDDYTAVGATFNSLV